MTSYDSFANMRFPARDIGSRENLFQSQRVSTRRTAVKLTVPFICLSILSSYKSTNKRKKRKKNIKHRYIGAMYLTSFFSSDDDFRNDHQNLTGDDYRVSG